MTVDPIDRRILRALQTDCRQTVAEIGAVAGLSPSACHRRIRNLEQAGVISGYGARLDRRALGYAMEFFVEVELRSQSDKALEAFERAVEAAPERYAKSKSAFSAVASFTPDAVSSKPPNTSGARW
jgi:Lrp/AsnC family leucine-responsive transcriptional regulator